jgi:hypothetical protein
VLIWRALAVAGDGDAERRKRLYDHSYKPTKLGMRLLKLPWCPPEMYCDTSARKQALKMLEDCYLLCVSKRFNV